MELHVLRVGYKVTDGKVEQSNMAKKKKKEKPNILYFRARKLTTYLTGRKYPLGYKLGQQPSLQKQ